MAQDAQGHNLSGATTAVAATYDQAARAFNLVHGDAIGLFDEARQAEPDFAMAHLGKAWVFTVANDPVPVGSHNPVGPSTRAVVLVPCGPEPDGTGRETRRSVLRLDAPAGRMGSA